MTGARVTGFSVGFAQKVIDAGVIKTGQFNQNGGGNVVLAGFIFGIAGLGHT